MIANKIDKVSVDGKKRTILSQVLPLDTPFTIVFCPIYACNFKCTYCLQSLPYNKRPFVSNKVEMPFDMYTKIINDMKKFPHKIKVLNFAGSGEPLLYKDIAKMLKYAVDCQVAETYEIVTNGSLLSQEMSDSLINSGVSRVRISVQGLDQDTYRKICGVDIEFNRFVEQIKYLFSHKTHMQLYIKILDVALENHSEQEFFDIFGNICDDIAIEHLVPTLQCIDFKTLFNKDFEATMNGNQPALDVDVCPRPFFSMNIYPDGNFVPCCAIDMPLVVGNANKESIVDVWNGRSFNAFRRMHLVNKNQNAVCRVCDNYKYVMFAEDNLDQDRKKLITKFL